MVAEMVATNGCDISVIQNEIPQPFHGGHPAKRRTIFATIRKRAISCNHSKSNHSPKARTIKTMASGQNNRYLKSSGKYAIDWANSLAVGVNAYGMQQDIDNNRLSHIVRTLGAEKAYREEAQEENKREDNLWLIALAGIILILILLILFRE